MPHFFLEDRRADLYADIPRLQYKHFNDIEYPAKIFIIEKRIIVEFALHALFGKNERGAVHMNSLVGPCEKGEVRRILSHEKTLELLNKQIKASNDMDVPIPEEPDFILGAIDIVTYPFFYASVYEINIFDGHKRPVFETVWKINNYLINEFIPNEATDHSGALTIFHFDEEIVANAPTHNMLFLGANKDTATHEYSQILRSPLNISYISRNNPFIDDRTVENGEYFDLVFFGKVIQEMRRRAEAGECPL